jgi:RNA polymerase sigma-70 factor, ECF subfamily
MFSKESSFLNGYENLSDSELASSAAEGDESAFNEIVRRFTPRVFRFAGRFFRRYSLVEEAAQEVFLKIFMQITSYDGRGSLEGWVTRITINTCINLLRNAKRQPELTISDLTDEESTWLEGKIFDASTAHHQNEEDKLIAADLVGRVLESLPPEDALVITMIDGDGASIKETAALTGWSESKVKVKAFRARRRMREAVEKLLKVKEDKFFKTKKN